MPGTGIATGTYCLAAGSELASQPAGHMEREGEREREGQVKKPRGEGGDGHAGDDSAIETFMNSLPYFGILSRNFAK